MSSTWVRVVTAVVSLVALAAGVWAVGAGWDLRTIHRDALSARQASTPTPGVVVGRDRVGGVELDVVTFDTDSLELTKRVLPPASGRPAVDEEIRGRLVMPETARAGQPLYAADHVQGASDRTLEAVGRRATVLLVTGFALAVVGAFVLSATLSFLWPDPKRRTLWHDDRYGG